jgi:hypothetical protein
VKRSNFIFFEMGVISPHFYFMKKIKNLIFITYGKWIYIWY